MPKRKARKQRKPFGRIRKLPSAAGTGHIEAGTCVAPAARNKISARQATLKPFAEAWLANRLLKPRTAPSPKTASRPTLRTSAAPATASARTKSNRHR